MSGHVVHFHTSMLVTALEGVYVWPLIFPR